MHCKHGHDNVFGAAFCSACGLPLTLGGSVERQPSPLLDTLRGQLLGERLRLLDRIGEGGMGVVYAAEQTLGITTRKVAVKMLWPSAGRDVTAKERFLREAAVVAQLEHPNTVRVYDFGATPEGMPFLVMEFLSGEPLSRLLRREGALSPSRVGQISRQIAGSLDEAHGRGIIHRDLKPANALLTEPGGVRDFVKLLDFGIAARAGSVQAESRLTQDGTVLGTPAYMSPEQFSGHQPVDARSDVYSLGVTLYELLTGVLPFEASSTRAWAGAHRSSPPRPFASTERGRQVPAGVQHAVLWALAKEPARRPASAGALHAAFEAGLGGTVAGAAAAAVMAPTVLLGFEPPRAEAPHAAPARTTGAVSMTEPSPSVAPPRDTGASIPWPPAPPPPAPPRPWWSRSMGIRTRRSAWLFAVPCLMVIALAVSRREPERGVASIERPGGDPAGGVMLPLQPAAPPPSGAPSLPGPAKPEASVPGAPSAKLEATAPAAPAKPPASASAPPTPPPAAPPAPTPKPEAQRSTTPRPPPAPRSTPVPSVTPENAPSPRVQRPPPSSRDGLAVGERREFAPGLGVERLDTDGTRVRLRISAGSHVHVYIDGHDGDSLSEDDYEDDDELDDEELRFVVEDGSVRVPWLSPGRHHVHAYWHNGHETQAEIFFGPGRLNIELRDPGRSRQ